MMELTVRGMSCGRCARAVTQAVHGINFAAKVEVDLATKLVAIESDADITRIAAAIEAAGYKVDRLAA